MKNKLKYSFLRRENRRNDIALFCTLSKLRANAGVSRFLVQPKYFFSAPFNCDSFFNEPQGNSIFLNTVIKTNSITNNPPSWVRGLQFTRKSWQRNITIAEFNKNFSSKKIRWASKPLKHNLAQTNYASMFLWFYLLRLRKKARSKFLRPKKHLFFEVLQNIKEERFISDVPSCCPKHVNASCNYEKNFELILKTPVDSPALKSSWLERAQLDYVGAVRHIAQGSLQFIYPFSELLTTKRDSLLSKSFLLLTFSWLYPPNFYIEVTSQSFRPFGDFSRSFWAFFKRKRRRVIFGPETESVALGRQFTHVSTVEEFWYCLVYLAPFQVFWEDYLLRFLGKKFLDTEQSELLNSFLVLNQPSVTDLDFESSFDMLEFRVLSSKRGGSKDPIFAMFAEFLVENIWDDEKSEPTFLYEDFIPTFLLDDILPDQDKMRKTSVGVDSRAFESDFDSQQARVSEDKFVSRGFFTRKNLNFYWNWVMLLKLFIFSSIPLLYSFKFKYYIKNSVLAAVKLINTDHFNLIKLTSDKYGVLTVSALRSDESFASRSFRQTFNRLNVKYPFLVSLKIFPAVLAIFWKYFKQLLGRALKFPLFGLVWLKVKLFLATITLNSYLNFTHGANYNRLIVLLRRFCGLIVRIINLTKFYYFFVKVLIFACWKDTRTFAIRCWAHARTITLFVLSCIGKWNVPFVVSLPAYTSTFNAVLFRAAFSIYYRLTSLVFSFTILMQCFIIKLCADVKTNKFFLEQQAFFKIFLKTNSKWLASQQFFYQTKKLVYTTNYWLICARKAVEFYAWFKPNWCKAVTNVSLWLLVFRADVLIRYSLLRHYYFSLVSSALSYYGWKLLIPITQTIFIFFQNEFNTFINYLKSERFVADVNREKILILGRINFFLLGLRFLLTSSFNFLFILLVWVKHYHILLKVIRARPLKIFVVSISCCVIIYSLTFLTTAINFIYSLSLVFVFLATLSWIFRASWGLYAKETRSIFSGADFLGSFFLLEWDFFITLFWELLLTYFSLLFYSFFLPALIYLLSYVLRIFNLLSWFKTIFSWLLVVVAQLLVSDLLKKFVNKIRLRFLFHFNFRKQFFSAPSFFLVNLLAIRFLRKLPVYTYNKIMHFRYLPLILNDKITLFWLYQDYLFILSGQVFWWLHPKFLAFNIRRKFSSMTFNFVFFEKINVLLLNNRFGSSQYALPLKILSFTAGITILFFAELLLRRSLLGFKPYLALLRWFFRKELVQVDALSLVCADAITMDYSVRTSHSLVQHFLIRVPVIVYKNSKRSSVRNVCRWLVKLLRP